MGCFTIVVLVIAFGIVGLLFPNLEQGGFFHYLLSFGLFFIIGVFLYGIINNKNSLQDEQD